jgi:hypothetical protein
MPREDVPLGGGVVEWVFEKRISSSAEKQHRITRTGRGAFGGRLCPESCGKAPQRSFPANPDTHAFPQDSGHKRSNAKRCPGRTSRIRGNSSNSMPAFFLLVKLLGRMAQGSTHRFGGEHLLLSLCIRAILIMAKRLNGIYDARSPRWDQSRAPGCTRQND